MRPFRKSCPKVSGRIRQPYRKWLRETARALSDRSESSFSRIWNKCVDRYLDRLDLKEVHSVLLKEAGTFLGQPGERYTGSHPSAVSEPDGILRLKNRGKDWASRIRIGRWLGVMSGLFLIVLLL